MEVSRAPYHVIIETNNHIHHPYSQKSPMKELSNIRIELNVLAIIFRVEKEMTQAGNQTLNTKGILPRKIICIVA
ncbi:MAG: hypothetical protein H0X50_07315 [Nitrosopumilus sp.]|nr:hypothetical protein [Nitrosopumilus sp.]